MVACFDAVRLMGFGENFSRGGKKSIIPGIAKNIFPGEGQSDKNSFYPPESKKTFFLLNN